MNEGLDPTAEAVARLRAALLTTLDEKAARVDRDRVAACFDFAATAHGGALRKSGEPFVSHLVGVCLILVDLLETRIDTTLACAALLHDVVEDTPVTIEDVERRFGKEIGLLVDGVTKLARFHFESREAAEADNFRRMILSMAQDLRVIFVKLGDRVHNMRTIEPIVRRDPAKAQRIALETRDIYAPLAHRLGIANIKRELEDLSLRVLDPVAYEDLVRRVALRYEERDAFLAEVRRRIAEGLHAVGIKAEVVSRPKHYFSIYQKVKAGGEAFESINDLFGTRIITRSRDDCYRVLGVVHDRFTPVPDRFKDYIATPKSNLYQSLHTTVLTEDGEMVEVQIRTLEMHRTAETGVAAHYVYKQGGRMDEELDAKLGGFVAQTADWQRTATDDEYMDFLRTALYQEEVFVYTPKRELKHLPKGATPLDFAFLIHTEVGQHTVGARVNGELVTLRHELRNGDMVEIVTSSHAQPHEDWLHIVRTANARGKIRHWLRQRRLSDSVSLGREMLERELKRLRKKLEDGELEKIASALGADDVEQLYARIAEGQLSITQVVRRLVPEKEGLAERLTKGPLEALGLGKKPAGGVRIQGIDNVMINFARCCQPVPGDRVIGIVTMGRGVSVHRIDCPNTFADRVASERKVTVEWDTAIGETFPVRLLVYGNDRTSLLADIAKAIAATQVNIRSAGIASEDRTARGVFVVEVPSLAKLHEVMTAVRKIGGVTRVERRKGLIGAPSRRRRTNGESG